MHKSVMEQVADKAHFVRDLLSRFYFKRSMMVAMP